MKFRNWIAAALCTAAVAGLAPAHAQTYKPEYKLSIVVGTTFPWGQGAEIWSTWCASAPRAASTSRSIPAPRWSRATRPANSPPSARA